ncbi:MAG: GNAT family N-acetyltransferase [Verrucomicrobiota bacterium]|nr:GNAT family N-acetyltransferase [Verrucomicrobiota bacterium]
MFVEIVERLPTVQEFAFVTAAVGFKAHPPEAIAIGLANSSFSVCAIAAGGVVGLGRVVGDGALHFSVTGVMVIPEFQRRGIGSRIVEALLSRVKQVPYANTLVEALPLPGLEGFLLALRVQSLPSVFSRHAPLPRSNRPPCGAATLNGSSIR